ncbi:tat-interacting protein [Stylonychia lemnae]|uniref:Tat-interacting protein n=1 Tax=Stylonychia lemnae TaxID=5949 RepID=A0A077ZST1_STYLE|nr:tat-interacting protein [Stylonychia lemnae]|eukprot:CDW72937.1 tat-interacting protein [Stylonychia lemnae]
MDLKSDYNQKVKIALIGATGAVGKEVVRLAKFDDRIEELSLIVRKPLAEWVAEDFSCKLVIHQLPDFNDLSSIEQKLQGYDIFLCTLGTLRKYGLDNFIKVDHDYPLNFAKLAKKLNVKQYGIVTAQGADQNSCLLYSKTKGLTELHIREQGLEYLTILRPGLLVNRDNDARCAEKFYACLPCIPRIRASEVGQVLLSHSINKILNTNLGSQSQAVEILSHGMIKKSIYLKKK